MASSEQTHRDPKQGGARNTGWTALAIVLFALAVLQQFQPILKAGVGENVPLPGHLARHASANWIVINDADLIYETWLVSRNARALLQHPFDFFEAPHCIPFDRSVTLGIPMVAMGVLAIPFVALSDNPVLVYNAVLMTMMLLASLAMFLLVREWTGSPPAAIFAGLLFALSPRWLESIIHPSQNDELWTVFAIYFAYRWLRHGRWRDALGLAGSFALQATESFYPFLAAVVGVPPILAWMLFSQRLGKIRFSQVVVVVGISVAVLYWMYEPYLATRAAGMWSDRTGIQVFASLEQYLPGGFYFPGFIVVAGVLAALFLGRRGLAQNLPGDPRFALVVSALLVAWFAAGPLAKVTLGSSFPDLYGFLESIFPGLDSIRVVVRLTVGVQLALIVLAGIGAAALVRLAGKQGALIGLLLIGLVGIDLVRPASLGLTPRFDWSPHRIEPDQASIDFFSELASQGNQGPVFEMPLDDKGDRTIWYSPTWIANTDYHGRRTSACFGSFLPSARNRFTSLAQKLPEPRALEELKSLGFTTIVYHHPRGKRRYWRQRFARSRVGAEIRLDYLHGTTTHSAWAIVTVPNERDQPDVD